MTSPGTSGRRDSETVTRARNILREQAQAPPPGELLSLAYASPVRVIAHPDYGTPLVLPDGHNPW